MLPNECFKGLVVVHDPAISQPLIQSRVIRCHLQTFFIDLKNALHATLFLQPRLANLPRSLVHKTPHNLRAISTLTRKKSQTPLKPRKQGQTGAGQREPY